MRTLITNGTIVTADGSYVADILIDGETIASIGHDLAGGGATADDTIDATGKYVIPGGIDVHTHMELPFGGTFAKDTFESGTRAAAFGGTTTHRRLRGPVARRVAARGPRHVAREGRGQRRHGLRLPHDHERRQRRHARRDGRARRRGRPGLQAVHRLPGRLLQRRRGDLPGAAADREERRADHDARRERHGHRRRRRPDRRGRHDRSDRPRARPQGRSSRARRRTGSSGWPRPPRRPSTSSTSRRKRGPRRGQGGPRPRHEGLRRDVPAVPVPLARRHGQRLRRRQVRLLAAAPDPGSLGRAVDRPRQGRPPARRPRTTARSTSTARRNSAAATSARSPTACRASRIGSTCSTTAASWPAGSRRSAGSRSSRRRRRSCSGCTRRRARSRSVRTRTSSSTTRTGRAVISAATPPHGRRLLVLRGPVGAGRRATSSCRAARSSSAMASSRGARATASSSSAPRPTTPGCTEPSEGGDGPRTRPETDDRRPGRRPRDGADGPGHDLSDRLGRRGCC